MFGKPKHLQWWESLNEYEKMHFALNYDSSKNYTELTNKEIKDIYDNGRDYFDELDQF